MEDNNRAFETLPFPDRQRIAGQIIKLLEEEKCTMRDADYILSNAARYIRATAPVQFLGMPDFEL